MYLFLQVNGNGKEHTFLKFTIIRACKLMVKKA